MWGRTGTWSSAELCFGHLCAGQGRGQQEMKICLGQMSLEGLGESVSSVPGAPVPGHSPKCSVTKCSLFLQVPVGCRIKPVHAQAPVSQSQAQRCPLAAAQLLWGERNRIPAPVLLWLAAGRAKGAAGQGQVGGVAPCQEFQWDASPAPTAKPRCVPWLAWGYLQFSVGQFAALFHSKIELSFLAQQTAPN